MKTFAFASAALLSFAALSLHSKDAHALGPVNVEVGGKLGYSTNPDGDYPYNPLGVGIGARGGVELFNSLYLGGNVMYYFGGSEDAAGGSVSSHALLLGVEAGYGFHLSILTIRPQLGIGEATLSTSLSGGLASATSADIGNSSTKLYLEPGVTAFVTLGVLYVGANVNVLLIPGVDQGNGDSKVWASFTPGIQVGARF